MKRSNQSKLPIQAAPVQRPSTFVAMSNANGVEASIASNIFDILSIVDR